MKELATLALVILPLGMTIVEILAAGGTSSAPEQPDRGIGVRAHSGRKVPAAPAAEEPRTGARRSRPLHALGAADEHAVPGKPA
jgi:hypothetical protein